MPHITVRDDLPGILGLFSFKPELSETITAFTQQLLRGPSSLTVGERETIAAFVSTLNACQFCSRSHTAAAVHTVGDRDVVLAAIDEPDSAPVTDKLRALLAVAGKVQRSGLEVTAEDVAAARAAGAEDEDIHDTVLVAAAFSMFNRYVDGLAATTPTDPDLYDTIGRRLAEQGYVTADLVPPRPPGVIRPRARGPSRPGGGRRRSRAGRPRWGGR